MGDYSKNVVKGLWWGRLIGLVVKRIDQPPPACVRIFRHSDACQDALSKNIGFQTTFGDGCLYSGLTLNQYGVASP